jgi:hypothetical protein
MPHRLGPVAARHAGDLGLRDLQASSEHALLAVLRQLPRHARIIEPRAVQEDHVMSASAQLRITESRLRKKFTCWPTIMTFMRSRYLDPDASRPASSVAAIMLVGSATSLPAMSNAVP